ncbi:hypothetical protein [Cellulosimicrobium sp. TH-20]|uniref:hypothetical protein n=1 Tax=Cellulosimicrobium sp. TH-20 TaxID=1980001 RepID=UPI001643A180|nr:hypothetical protein [Cellulosimicrobium sp. TH-20]
MQESGTRAPRRAPFVALETSPGSYSNVPAWTSREAYLDAVASVAATMRADRARSLVAVAEAFAKFADHTTGREVRVGIERVVALSGVPRRTVFRRVNDLKAAGLLETVDAGGYMRREERAQVRAAGGRHVTKTTTRALSVPREMAHNHSRRELVKNLTSPELTNARTRAAKKTTSKPKTDRAARPMRLQRLAAAVDRRLPYLVRSRHVGNLANVLQAAGVEEWSASDVVGAVDAWHAENGRATLATAARDSLAWFAWALREARKSGQESRTAASRAAQEAARRRAAERAQERAEEDARAARTAASPEAATARLSIRDALAAAKAARVYGAAV